MYELDNGQTVHIDNDRLFTCSVENYIMGNVISKDGCSKDMAAYSICREERQYAVFLYNILRKYRKPESRKPDSRLKHIFHVCKVPEEAEITGVFYEATFMRDFFERNRRIHWAGNPKETEKKLLQKSFSPPDKRIAGNNSFNYRLLKYVYEDRKEQGTFPIPPEKWKLEEKNLGHNEYSDKELDLFEKEIIEDMQPYVRQMMNAKPDIAVIYHTTHKHELHEAGKNYLLFLECKFESGESFYPGKGSEQNVFPRLTQCTVQGKIADFLCANYLDIEVSPSMRNENKKNNHKYASPMIQFVRKNPDETNILINDLIHLNNQIFEN